MNIPGSPRETYIDGALDSNKQREANITCTYGQRMARRNDGLRAIIFLSLFRSVFLYFSSLPPQPRPFVNFCGVFFFFASLSLFFLSQAHILLSLYVLRVFCIFQLPTTVMRELHSTTQPPPKPKPAGSFSALMSLVVRSVVSEFRSTIYLSIRDDVREQHCRSGCIEHAVHGCVYHTLMGPCSYLCVRRGLVLL